MDSEWRRESSKLTDCNMKCLWINQESSSIFLLENPSVLQTYKQSAKDLNLLSVMWIEHLLPEPSVYLNFAYHLFGFDVAFIGSRERARICSQIYSFPTFGAMFRKSYPSWYFYWKVSSSEIYLEVFLFQQMNYLTRQWINQPVHCHLYPILMYIYSCLFLNFWT